MAEILDMSIGRRQDLTGMRFGRLVVTAYAGRYPKNNPDTVWTCKCDCGRVKLHAKAASLKNGRCQSCGCKKFEESLWLLRDEKPRNKLGIAGISAIVNPRRKQKKPVYVVRVDLKRNGVRLRQTLYSGTNFFEACCARKSYENERLRIGNFI